MSKYAEDNYSQQLCLWADNPIVEDSNYLSKQIITYTGNKRALLGYIGNAVEKVKKRLGKSKLKIADLFSGSGIVSRYLKSHTSLLISNDIEDYAAAISRCYLRNRSTVDLPALSQIISELNAKVMTVPFPPGFIEELYAPKDENNITKEDRVFYTRENAKRIDNYRRLIEDLPSEIKDLILGPLLSKASVHSNTAGTFEGFFKDCKTGIGKFGGSGFDDLKRILKRIKLEIPILSLFETEYTVFQEDANSLIGKLKGLDLAYIDPPYNQRSYNCRYFMLNLITNYQRPINISPVLGIPNDRLRSGYNSKGKALPLLKDVFYNIDTSFLLISYNNEGFITPEDMCMILNEIGLVEVSEIPYHACLMKKNTNNRSIHVTEYLFLVERR